LSHVIIVNPREKFVRYTDYENDERDRIRFMKMFLPEENVEELVRTRFYYSADSYVLYKTDVISLLEKKVRLIH
jgi:hypothetical protein